MRVRIVRGEELRDQGMQRVIEHTTEDYRSEFTRAFDTLVRGGDPFTSEDVIELCGMPPNHHNTVGALMSAILRPELSSGRVEYLGHVKKKIAKGHAARIGQYRGKT